MKRQKSHRSPPLLPAERVPAADPVPVQQPAAACWWLTILAVGLVVLATVAAYDNSFAGVFIYDDLT